MILKLKQDLSKEDIEVCICYAQMDGDVKRIISLIKSADTKIKCSNDGQEQLINVADIYYIESVDKKTFIYCEKAVYRTELRLYQLLDKIKKYGFVQINKACILNINVLDSIKSLINSRMEATLKNEEHLLVTRKYLAGIRAALTEESL